MSLMIKKPQGTIGQGIATVETREVPVASGTGLAGVAGSYAAATSTSISTTLVAGKMYKYAASCDSWICQSSTATVAAAATAGNMFIAKGSQQMIDGFQGSKLFGIADAALTGAYSLVEVTL